MSYQIKVYKAEREAGLAQVIQANASIAYCVPVEPMPLNTPLAHYLQTAFAAKKEDKTDADFDLFYMQDIMVSTGWNINTDIFDRGEIWAARHTPEDKPFNFEHRPLDIIGHITASKVVDVDLNELTDELAIEELPDKFHIVSGSVLYLMLPDDERKKLMQETVAEIKRGEWFVSMECYFRGFDYGIIEPDGSQRIIARDESSTWLTKHLRQYGGDGVYVDHSTGSEYQIGRVVRNITFSGKGLVRKPANPESIIFNTVAAFTPIITDSGYLKAGAGATASSKTEESNEMAENTAEQALRDQLTEVRNQLTKANETIESLKHQDKEATITKLRDEVTAKDKTIQDRDQTIANLTTQLDTAKDANKQIQTRAETAEASLKTANDELATVKVAEQTRNRLAILTEKGAEATVAQELVKRFAKFDDKEFEETVAFLTPTWKKPEPPATKPKVDPAKAAIDKAKVEEEPSLSTNDEDEAEQARATVVNFIGKSLFAARGHTPAGKTE